MKTVAVDLVARVMELVPQIPAEIDPEILAGAIACAVSSVVESTNTPAEVEAIEKQLASECAEAMRFLAGRK